MPNIRPITDLRDSADEISDFCKTTLEPVFITRNGAGDMVIMSVEAYERCEAQLALYAKLAEAEAEAASGETGADFAVFAQKLRASVHGALSGVVCDPRTHGADSPYRLRPAAVSGLAVTIMI